VNAVEAVFTLQATEIDATWKLIPGKCFKVFSGRENPVEENDDPLPPEVVDLQSNPSCFKNGEGDLRLAVERRREITF